MYSFTHVFFQLISIFLLISNSFSFPFFLCPSFPSSSFHSAFWPLTSRRLPIHSLLSSPLPSVSLPFALPILTLSPLGAQVDGPRPTEGRQVCAGAQSCCSRESSLPTLGGWSEGLWGEIMGWWMEGIWREGTKWEKRKTWLICLSTRRFDSRAWRLECPRKLTLKEVTSFLLLLLLLLLPLLLMVLEVKFEQFYYYFCLFYWSCFLIVKQFHFIVILFPLFKSR